MKNYLFIAILITLFGMSEKIHATTLSNLFYHLQQRIEFGKHDHDIAIYLQNQLEFVEANISKDIFLKYINCTGGSDLLHYIDYMQKQEELVLESDPQYSTPITLGETLLYTAINKGCLKTAKLLLNKGADTNQKNNTTGATPLLCAIYRVIRCGLNSKEKNIIFINLLLEHGANPNARDESNITPFIQMVIGLGTICKYDENLGFDILEKFLEKGASATIKPRKHLKAYAHHMPEGMLSDFIHKKELVIKCLKISEETYQKLVELLNKYPKCLEPNESKEVRNE